ncbi:helix-turn-helix domain-containing protein [Streptomyces uncialis]|uniref:helix-turn-helix domain-containing protein n=1 Tax=Streptomyces uncialis TaxID=1048205 RepID=UPI003867ED07|nr:helix-turn-helix domain-containing protein [Streptomyces uncialis]
MPALPYDHTAARIKRLRLERHLTQKALADLSGVAYSTLTKTEQGVIPATPYVLGCLARALRIDVSTLNGQPYAAELRADELDILILPIREALDVYDLGADPEIAPRPRDRIAADAEALCAAVRHGDLKLAAARVSALIPEATTAAHLDGATEDWLTLASTYRTAYDVTTKLGYTDLATLALARMDWAAQRGSSAVAGGIHRYMRALTYLRSGHYRTGRRLVDLGLEALGQADPGRERDVATGQLHLGAAVVAGRSQNRGQAEEHLTAAEHIAQRTGEAVQVWWLAFGPTNVAVHRVSVLAEINEYEAAVTAGLGLTLPEDWPASRKSHHHAELARSRMWTGDTDGSYRSLVRARKSAPQQARYSPTVRQTYQGLETAKRRLPGDFLSYGTWLGV